jgi:predicted aspartyl protease
MPDYDAARYNPPAPVARVALRNPQTSAELADQPLLIDTGADATLIPQAALVPLGLQPIAEVTYELIAFDGTRSVASVADLDLVFLNRRFRGRYLLTHEDTGVLGRGILNHLTLVFDGPGNEWTEHR